MHPQVPVVVDGEGIVGVLAAFVVDGVRRQMGQVDPVLRRRLADADRRGSCGYTGTRRVGDPGRGPPADVQQQGVSVLWGLGPAEGLEQARVLPPAFGESLRIAQVFAVRWLAGSTADPFEEGLPGFGRRRRPLAPLTFGLDLLGGPGTDAVRCPLKMQALGDDLPSRPDRRWRRNACGRRSVQPLGQRCQVDAIRLGCQQVANAVDVLDAVRRVQVGERRRAGVQADDILGPHPL